jgi:dihydroneopterin aldolase/2-amino-4-hydroxy-6-hydroxymethyldihydropteridine diphosphokinase
MVEAYIGVGSNIAPEYNLPKALKHLKKQVKVVAVSTVYRTAPIGRTDQPFYLNTVWQIRTDRSPRQIKSDVLRRIEVELGRVRTQDRYRARTIDLDLLLYGELVIREADLVIPDPDIRQRPFLAIPLLELNPELILPDTQERLQYVVSAFKRVILESVPEITWDLQRMVNDE